MIHRFRLTLVVVFAFQMGLAAQAVEPEFLNSSAAAPQIPGGKPTVTPLITGAHNLAFVRIVEPAPNESEFGRTRTYLHLSGDQEVWLELPRQDTI